MSRGLEAPDLLAAVEAAMERAAEAVELDLYFELKDARGELARCLCHGVVALTVFDVWEPQYERAGKVASVELPAAIDKAQRLLQRIGGETVSRGQGGDGDRTRLRSAQMRILGSNAWRRFLDAKGWDAYYRFHAIRARYGETSCFRPIETASDCLDVIHEADAYAREAPALRAAGVEPDGFRLLILPLMKCYAEAQLAARQRLAAWLA